MDCRDIQERLDVFAWGGLDGPGTAVVAKHLRHCESCREELEDIRGWITDCRAALRHPLPIDRFEELWAKVEAGRRRDRAVLVIQAWRCRVARQALAVAAALVLLVWLGPKLEAPTQPAVDPAKQVDAAVRPFESSPLVERRILMEKYLALSSGEKAEDLPAAKPAQADAPNPQDAAEPSAADETGVYYWGRADYV